MSTTLPLLLLSGWGATAQAWQDVLLQLPECRAHTLGWETCLQDWPDALLKALDREPGRWAVAGWSLGGLLALRTALEAPERVAAVVLVAGTARMCADGAWPGAAPRALRAMQLRLGRSPELVLSDFAQACMTPDGTSDMTAEYLLQAETFAPEELELGLNALAELDLRARLTEIRVPVLVIHGKCDAVIPLASAETLVEALPRAQLLMLPTRGHALPWTASGQVAQAIGSVLA